MTQQTLVLIKPDAMQKNISGKIIERLESSELKIKAIKMIHPNQDLAEKHYPLDESWAKNVFNKTKSAYDKLGKTLEFSNHLDLGKEIQSRLKKFLVQSPIIAIVIQGDNAINKVRKIIGHTEPKQSERGTIRGDFAPEESYEKADAESRALHNLIHASDSKENAQREISVWFSKEEIY